jgi:hypothetical protein
MTGRGFQTDTTPRDQLSCAELPALYAQNETAPAISEKFGHGSLPMAFADAPLSLQTS